MDNNMVTVERTKFKDLIEALSGFFSSKTATDEAENDKKLQKVYEVEKEIGATNGIASLEKFLGIFSSSKSTRRKGIKKEDIAPTVESDQDRKNNVEKIVIEDIEK